MTNKIWKTIQPFLVAIGLTFLVGGLSYLASGGNNQELYESLVLPKGAPPAQLFGVVWPLWYLLLGIAAALVYRSEPSVAKSEGLRFYELQLLILFTWPIVFSGCSPIGRPLRCCFCLFLCCMLCWTGIGRQVRPPFGCCFRTQHGFCMRCGSICALLCLIKKSPLLLQFAAAAGRFF